MATTVYSVSHSEGVHYVPVKKDAVKSAREAKRAGDEYVTVQEHVVTRSYRSTRELTCALLNGESWCSSTSEVKF